MKKTNMSLIKLTINKNYKDRLLDYLSKLNTVHIKSKDKSHSIDKKLDKDTLRDKIKILRANIDVLFNKIKINDYIFHELKFDKSERIQFEVKNIYELINHVFEEIYFYSNRISELERYIARAQIELNNIVTIKDCYTFLDKFDLTRESLGEFKYLDFKIYTTFTKNIINLENIFEFTQFPNVHQTFNISNDRVVFFVIYPKDKQEDLNNRINIIHAEGVPILKKYLTATGINFTRILNEIDLIENTIKKYEKEFERIREDHLLKFAAINEITQNIEEYYWAEQQFTPIPPDRLMLKFFVQRYKKQSVIQNLIKTFKEEIFIESKEISKKHKTVEQDQSKGNAIEVSTNKELKRDDSIEKTSPEESEGKDLRDETPTIMKNFFLFRPFETLTRMYGTPSYQEIDPTPVLFFTFPLMFGLMFGDMGHGICLILSGLIGAIVFRKKKGEDFYNLCWIIFWCGWGAVLGGYLYGEFFGMPHILGYELEPVSIIIPFKGVITLHNPLENIMTVFIFAILVGVFHINLGWFIQGLNYWKQSRKYLTLTDSFCKIALLSGGTILVFIWGFDINSWLMYPYPILLPLLPGILLIVLKPIGKIFRLSYLKQDSVGELIGEGSMETFETVLSVMSNVASYIRLLALALAHIALMLSVTAVIGLIQGEGIFILIIIIIALILGNLVVILLEGILVFINAIRLHFYEFFFKFYQGSGTDFFPFYLDDDYSIINFKSISEKDVISEEIEREIDSKDLKEDLDDAISYISDKFF